MALKNKSRKEELKRLSLRKLDNGGRIYQLLCSNKLDKIIDLITDDKTPAIKTSFVKKGYLTGNEQFLDMLSNFLYYFDMNFPTVTHKDLMIQMILESQTPEFLLCKKYWGDNDNIEYFKNSMDKTIALNFYNNTIFIDDGKTFQRHKIIPHKMNLDDRKDLDIVLNFMKDILWTNINIFSNVYLFHHYAVKEKSFKRTCKGKNQLEIFSMLLGDYRMHFDILLKNYHENKKILNFLK